MQERSSFFEFFSLVLGVVRACGGAGMGREACTDLVAQIFIEKGWINDQHVSFLYFSIYLLTSLKGGPSSGNIFLRSMRCQLFRIMVK